VARCHWPAERLEVAIADLVGSLGHTPHLANLAAALARAGRLAEARQRLQGARHAGAPRRGGAGSPLYGRGERQAGAHTRLADLLARFTEGFDTADLLEARRLVAR